MRFHLRAPRCPRCGSREYAISRPRGTADFLCLALRVARPVRCRHCRQRWYVFQWLPGAKPESIDTARQERRATRRHAFAVPALFRTTTGAEGRGETVNISAGGLLFRGDMVPAAGDELLLYLKPPGGQFLVQGVVRWAASDVAGIRFLRPVAELPEVEQVLQKLESTGIVPEVRPTSGNPTPIS